jgi:uncharacterized membrane protein YcaP (DUF421 family)
MDIAFWSSADQVTGTVVRTALVYFVVLVAVRVAGRRTLAQMSAFDTIVTVGLGTLAASTALPSGTTLADFIAVLLTFLILQTLLAALRQRSARVRQWLDFQPEVIVRNGRPELRRAPWTAQLTDSDLESRLRQNGVTDLAHATLVVLESTGQVTVTTTAPPPALFRRAAPDRVGPRESVGDESPSPG